MNPHDLRKWAIESFVQFATPGQWAGIINNTIRYKKGIQRSTIGWFHTRSHTRFTHANNSLTSIISLAIQNAARPRALNHWCVLRAGWSLEMRALELLDGVGEVQHLRVQLPDESLQLVHGVEHFHALGVGVEAHLEGSRHGGHPASIATYNCIIITWIFRRYSKSSDWQRWDKSYLNLSLASSKLSAT